MANLESFSPELVMALTDYLSGKAGTAKSIKIDKVASLIKEFKVDPSILPSSYQTQNTNSTNTTASSSDKKKSKKKTKDLNAPKKEASPYIKFSTVYRAHHKGEKTGKELTSDAGELWRSVKDDENKMNELFEQYNVEEVYQEMQKNKKNDNSTPSTIPATPNNEDE